MLVVKTNQEVDWPVTVNVPQNGGTVEKIEVTVRYRLAKKEDWKAMGNKSAKEGLLAHVIGWDGFVDENEKPIAFSKKNLAALLEYGFIEMAISKGLINASNGAAEKN